MTVAKSTKESLMMMLKRVKVMKFFQMGILLMANIKMEKNAVLEHLYEKKKSQDIQAVLKMVILTVVEKLHGIMVENMMENGKKIDFMEKVNSHIQMAEFTKDHIVEVKNKDMGL